jgi:hypothetical protein
MEDETWKTYLLINYDNNEQYIVFYRIGIYKEICFEFMMTFPNIKDNNSNKKDLAVVSLAQDYVDL